MSAFVVYRMYDADEALLYVGRSTRGLDRIEEHRLKEWWREVDIVTVEHFETRDESAAAERAAIASESPKYNKAGLEKASKVVDIPTGLEDASHEMPVRMLTGALKAWRDVRGLTLDDLAAIAGIDPFTLGFIERGTGDPIYSDALRIAEALAVPLEAIAIERPEWSAS